MIEDKDQARPERRKEPRRELLLWEELLALPPDAQARELARDERG